MPVGKTNLILQNIVLLSGWSERLSAAAQQSDYECILVPSEISGMVAKKKADSIKVGQAVKSGDFGKLTIQQVQKIAQANKIGIARTKSDFIKLLKPHEPFVVFDNIKGAGLKPLLKKHKIGALRSKDELIDLIKQKAGKAPKLGPELTVKKIAALKSDVSKGCNQVWESGFDDFIHIQQKMKSVNNSLKELKSLIPEGDFKALQTKYEQIQKAFVESKKSLKGSVVKKLGQQHKIHHYQWASKSELVTIMTSDDPLTISAIKKNIEVKWLKWSEKHGKKVTSTTTKPKIVKPKTPDPVVKLSSTPIKKSRDWTEIDDTWNKFASGKPFKFQGRADIEGAHTKYFFTDDNGNRWLFKPAEEFRAHGDEVAYRIGRLIDPDAVEVRFVKLKVPGENRLRTGSIQRWRNDLKSDFDFRNIPVNKLTASEIEQLQREHVVDWLISNHDGHMKQFLRTQDNRLVAIDKGQLFKYLGDDELSIAYHPNKSFGEAEPFYNTLMRAWRDGKIKMNLQSTYRHIFEMEKLTDEAYKELLRPYAERRFKNQKLKLKQFYETAISRKNNLKSDFEEFYTRLLRDKTDDSKAIFRFDTGISKINGKNMASERLPKGAEKWIDDINAAGWQGRTLPVDVDDIEDQNVLFFTENFKGQQRTIARMKIRPEAEKKLMKVLREQAQWSTNTRRIGMYLEEDIFYDDILAAVKTINYHINKGDYKFNGETIAKAISSHKAKLKKLAAHSDKDISAMAKSYTKMVNEVAKSQKQGGKIKIGEFKQFVRRHDDTLSKTPMKSNLRVETHNELRMDKKTVRQGKISVEQENVNISKLCCGSNNKGLEYEIDFGEGVTGVYRPWDGSNYYAHQGTLELRIAESCKVKTVENLLDSLERLGISASLATAEEAEILYLSKMAYILKEDKTPRWKGLLKKISAKHTSQSERVKALREYWAAQLGVDDVTKIPGYDPEGRFSIMHSTWKQRKQAGYRLQERFDITDQMLDREMKNHYLFHNITNTQGRNMSNFIDDVLSNNGAMVSTMEKMRAGVSVGGMSPESDMMTGGANYFFTRIRQVKPGQSAREGLYFKKNLLRRMDAITYNSDKFGRVTGNTVRNNRLSQIDDWKAIAQRGGSDETIFKNNVTLLDNLDMIITSNESKRAAVIKAFKKNGITKLPDGRPVSSIVQVR